MSDPALRSRLETACERAASEGIALAVGVSTVHRGLDAVGAAYREALQAARLVADAGGVLVAAGPEGLRLSHPAP